MTYLKAHLGWKYCSEASYSSALPGSLMKIYKEKTDYAYKEQEEKAIREALQNEQKVRLYGIEMKVMEVEMRRLLDENKTLKTKLELLKTETQGLRETLDAAL